MSSLIPDAFGKMISLVHLNLAYNDFVGGIPKSFANLSRLESLKLKWSHVTKQVAVVLDKLSGLEKSLQILNFDSIQLSGTLPDFTRFLSLRELYLGGNKLSGAFPKSFRRVLPNLLVLELHGNQISGMLPDLTAFPLLMRNRLFGEIPPTLAALNFLSVLDLLNNNLSGKIPTSTQLQSFDASVYSRNAQLCGVPLLDKCPGEEQGGAPGNKKGIQEEEDEDWFTTPSFYISLGIGFACGFWAIFGTILFSSVSRYVWFKFLDKVAD
ncbi:hypothetical protein RHMOL_Rhmol09G0194300 [Rhododendron molle]|uniref:Uncharacterized protein n=1 Tax=Rhododendron molle TaxID=49168 RepID=A0ACC0MF53_RHOML|nr:hypothetical protein RHMOL_Rhmol09G0194300 [Rhododendron molle]